MSSRPASAALRNSCTASCDATSPDACPPMPSATTKSDSFLSTRKLSSFASRFLPTSVAAQKDSSMRRVSPEPSIAIMKTGNHQTRIVDDYLWNPKGFHASRDGLAPAELALPHAPRGLDRGPSPL